MRRLFVTILGPITVALLAVPIPATAVTITVSTESFERAWQEFAQLSPEVRADRRHEAIKICEEWLLGACDREGAPKPEFAGYLARHFAGHVDPERFQDSRRIKLVSDAEADLDRARQVDPSYLPAYLGLSLTCYHSGQLREAIQYLEFVRGVCGDGRLGDGPTAAAFDGLCCNYLAWCYRGLGAWEQGLAMAEAGLRRDPDSQFLLLAKGLLLADSGRIDEANAFAETLPVIEVPHLNFVVMKVDYVPSRYAKDWIRAQAQLAVGHPERARTIFAKDLEAKLRWELIPRAREYWNDIGLVYELTEPGEAARYYDQAYHNLRYYGYLPVATGTMAPVFADLPYQGVPVFTAFEREYVVGSPFAFAAHQLAVLQQNWGTTAGDAARVRLLDTVENLAARNIRPDFCHGMRGRLAYLDGDQAGAQAELLAARDLLRAAGAGDPATTLILAQISLESGDEQAAADYFDEVVQATPAAAPAWRGLGISLARTGQVDRALAAMNEAVARDPGSAAGWYNRGMLQYNLGLFDAAEQDLLRAHELDPDRTEVVTMLQAVSRARRGP